MTRERRAATANGDSARVGPNQWRKSVVQLRAQLPARVASSALSILTRTHGIRLPEESGLGRLPHHQVLRLTANVPHGAATSGLQRVKDRQVSWQGQPEESLRSQAEVDELNEAPMVLHKAKDGSSILCMAGRGQLGKLGGKAQAGWGRHWLHVQELLPLHHRFLSVTCSSPGICPQMTPLSSPPRT